MGAAQELLNLRLGRAPSHSPLSCQVPTPTTETTSPVLPSLRYFTLVTCGPARRQRRIISRASS